MIMLLFFISFFTLKKSPSMHGLLESFSACFRKALINPIYPGLDIAV